MHARLILTGFGRIFHFTGFPNEMTTIWFSENELATCRAKVARRAACGR